MLKVGIDLSLCERLAPAPQSKQVDLDLLSTGKVRVNPHPSVNMDLCALEWGADPFDRNWRHSFHSLRWLDAALWGMSVGDVAARDLWIGVTRSWVEQNPPSIAGERPQAWANMIDGIRAIKLVQAAPHVARVAAHDLPWLVQSMREHMAWLADEANLGHSNHALHQHEALFTLATVLGDGELVELAVHRLKVLFDTHWSKDGMNAEGAVVYHHMNYLWWGRVVDLLEKAGNGAQESFREVLRRAPVLLAHATRPDGTFVNIGDSDSGRPTKVNHPATRWVTTGGAQGEPPSENLLVHPDGYILGRSGWGGVRTSFR